MIYRQTIYSNQWVISLDQNSDGKPRKFSATCKNKDYEYPEVKGAVKNGQDTIRVIQEAIMAAVEKLRET